MNILSRPVVPGAAKAPPSAARQQAVAPVPNHGRGFFGPLWPDPRLLDAHDDVDDSGGRDADVLGWAGPREVGGPHMRTEPQVCGPGGGHSVQQAHRQ